ncbi:hypothetical protein UFOVP1292_31 [uncultured Caudovirales phage]|uniref:Uncharacterized protein n=1 Tax=uncultured Caudovirales phage TaxID=2100421 RepID=A0A6J5PJU0_9CAUD|nr:hypothetical protein UFOVP859_64 [uncultured Caudovirales phage]CAB4168536.1 hypothetical protein UFOVP882_62 [uncultured Caudovirales phage]CAB4196427.1 hypothetical protein UFOVP1292_31 [uncultured Caudovirales phage]CAB4205105.1 hypothetical protein UFOVP1411_22 [uncultured Caudovirales phage]
MAKASSGGAAGRRSSTAKKVISDKHLRTSIGNSPNSRPKNKSKKRDFKPYRGQGKPS